MNIEIWEKILIPLILTIIGILGKLFHGYFTKQRPRTGGDIIISPNISPVISVGTDLEEITGDFKNSNFEIIRNDVQESLKRIKENFSCDRVWVGKFHNGIDSDSYHQGVYDWQLFSLIEAIEHLGVAKMKFYLRHIPTVFYKEIFTEIVHNKYFYIQDTQELDPPMSYFYHNHGIRSTIMTGMFDKAGNLKGILGIDTINRELSPPSDEHIQYLLSYSQRLVNILPTYIVKKENT